MHGIGRATEPVPQGMNAFPPVLLPVFDRAEREAVQWAGIVCFPQRDLENHLVPKPESIVESRRGAEDAQPVCGPSPAGVERIAPGNGGPAKDGIDPGELPRTGQGGWHQAPALKDQQVPIDAKNGPGTGPPYLIPHGEREKVVWGTGCGSFAPVCAPPPMVKESRCSFHHGWWMCVCVRATHFCP